MVEMHFKRPEQEPVAPDKPWKNAPAFRFSYLDTGSQVDVYAEADYYILKRYPRGRLCRLGPSDPLTNIQRAIVLGQIAGWLPQDIVLSDCIRVVDPYDRD